jgi:hypothetical protein
MIVLYMAHIFCALMEHVKLNECKIARLGYIYVF